MNVKKAFYCAAAASFALNWCSMPYAAKPMQEAARFATAKKLEMFAANLREGDKPTDPNMPPPLKIEELANLRYGN